MTEQPPRFLGRRFREISWLALRSRPVAALGGLYWFVTRRRVRGWSRLLVAASEGSYDYDRWTVTGERRAFSRFRQSYSVRHPIKLVPLVLAAENADRDLAAATVASLERAFGNSVPIHVICNEFAPFERAAGESLSALASYLAGTLDEGWLLPVFAGDVVSPAVVDVIQRACGDTTRSALVYWDEDTMGREGREDPWIKPDWDDLLFPRFGGLAGAAIVSVAAARGVDSSSPGGLDKQGLERALSVIAKDGRLEAPRHIPLILTHRSPANSLSAKTSDVMARSASFAKGSWPAVSVIVPTRDRADLLAACVRGLNRTSYSGEVELIFIDNGTTNPAALQILDELGTHPRTKVIRDPRPFNFSRLNNDAASSALGEYLCFLNNDVEAIDDDWLEKMVAYAMDETAGAVGALLLYPSGRIQHAGVALGLGGAAGHLQKGVSPSERRFWTWHGVTREVSAVTAAVMVTRKSKFVEVGGFDADAFPVAFNDVDLCLRLKEAGYRNLYVADARLIHRESETRGNDRNRANFPRYSRELAALQKRWNTNEVVDPHFSPLFSRLAERCVLIP